MANTGCFMTACVCQPKTQCRLPWTAFHLLLWHVYYWNVPVCKTQHYDNTMIEINYVCKFLINYCRFTCSIFAQIPQRVFRVINTLHCISNVKIQDAVDKADLYWLWKIINFWRIAPAPSAPCCEAEKYPCETWRTCHRSVAMRLSICQAFGREWWWGSINIRAGCVWLGHDELLRFCKWNGK